MRRKAFYAWQSSLPEETHRRFIEGCLRSACEDPRNLCPDVDELLIDQDTQGMPGSPDVAGVILEKIKRCDIFIADVSIINAGSPSEVRKTPNPNVMFELGFAVGTRTWERILCILNKASGDVEALPFDLRHHRVLRYALGPDREDEPAVRGGLIAELKSNISSILNGNLPLIARELRQLFDDINPGIMDNFRRGKKNSEVDIPTYYSQRLEDLMVDNKFSELASFVQQTKTIIKPDLGPIKVFRVKVTEKFIELAG